MLSVHHWTAFFDVYCYKSIAKLGRVAMLGCVKLKEIIIIKRIFDIYPVKSGTLFENYKILTQRGRVTHICAGKLTIVGSDNCLSPGRRKANIWTGAGILLIGTLRTNFTSNRFIQENAFKNVMCEMVSNLSRPQCGKHRYQNENNPYICITNHVYHKTGLAGQAQTWVKPSTSRISRNMHCSIH